MASVFPLKTLLTVAHVVPDPYYGEAAEFERMLDLVEDGVQGQVVHCRGRPDLAAT